MFLTNKIFLGYVEKMKQLLFKTSKEDRNAIKAKYNSKIPEPLNRQFPERVSKGQAIESHGVRKRRIAELFPSGI